MRITNWLSEREDTNGISKICPYIYSNMVVGRNSDGVITKNLYVVDVII